MGLHQPQEGGDLVVPWPLADHGSIGLPPDHVSCAEFREMLVVDRGPGRLAPVRHDRPATQEIHEESSTIRVL